MATGLAAGEGDTVAVGVAAVTVGVNTRVETGAGAGAEKGTVAGAGAGAVAQTGWQVPVLMAAYAPLSITKLPQWRTLLSVPAILIAVHAVDSSVSMMLASAAAV